MADDSFLRNFMSISDYLFTISSSVLSFLLLRTFQLSDYKKSFVEKKYLEKDAIEDLIGSSVKIKDCIKNNQTKGLSKAVREVKNIYKHIETQPDDVILKAYSKDVKNVINLVNRYKLETIGSTKNVEKITKLTSRQRNKLITSLDSLIKGLIIFQENRKEF